MHLTTSTDMDTKRGLTDLPSEVMVNIALGLDKTSARALATVCKVLQEPAEARIWSDLTVTASYPCGTHGHHVSPPSFNDRWGLLPDELYARARSPASRILRLNAALSTTSWRMQSLSTLKLDLHPEIPAEIIGLLKHAPSLSSLTLKLKPSDMMVLPARGLISSVQLLESVSLPNLKEAVLDVQHLYPRTIAALLHAAPALARLYLTLYSQYLLELPLADEASRNRPVVLPNSTHLHTLVVNPRTTDIPLLTELIQRSPKLAQVALRDDGQSWKPQDHPDFWDALGQCPIERLETTQRGLQEITADRFPILKHFSMSWSTAALSDVIDKTSTIDLLPNLPSLETYHLNITGAGRPQDDFTSYAFSDRVFLADLWLPPITELSKITYDTLILHSQNVPHLHTVTLPDGPKSLHRSDMAIAGGRNWGDTNFSGFAIRSYVSQGQEVCHLRASPNLVKDPIGSEEQQEAAWCGAEPIPLTVLRAMCAVEGKDMREFVPGRAQIMGDGGWAVLRQWRLGNY